jgi:hypothetical protein
LKRWALRSVVFGCGALLVFDGRTLDGGCSGNGTAEYRVENGATVGRTSDASPHSFLDTA